MNLPRSIRWRLQFWHGLILLLVLAGFGFTAHQLQWSNELRRLDRELDQRLNLLLRVLRDSRPGGRPPEAGPHSDRSREGPQRVPLRLSPDQAVRFGGESGFYYAVWWRTGRRVAESTNAPAGLNLPAAPAEPQATPTHRTRLRGDYREVYAFTPPGECILAGVSVRPLREEMRGLTWWLTGAGGLVLLLGLTGGWFMAARALQPVADISATAGRIAAGDLSERISTARTDDELGRLTTVLNTTFARLDESFGRQRQFTADASHELRTPISVILNQSQSALARERPAGEYRDALEACQRAAQRMRRLTESLLVLVRLDAGQGALEKQPCDLAEIGRWTVEQKEGLASARGITVETSLRASPCCGDPDKLFQILANLLTNAIRHNREGGQVVVSTWNDGGWARASVKDNGPGIAEVDLPHIFERFYQADPARGLAAGGAGLGLAICRALVEAHRGSIEVRSRPGEGAEFTVSLPAGAGDREGGWPALTPALSTAERGNPTPASDSPPAPRTPRASS